MNATSSLYRPVVQLLQDAFGQRLRTVVLFGSQARGDALMDSDRDLFVVVTGLPRDPMTINRAVRFPLLPILGQLPGSIAFVAKTPDEVQANLSPLLLDVCVEGICLYGQDYFEPYRRSALAALKSSGMERLDVGGVRMWVLPQGPSLDWELNWEGFRERV